MVLFLKFAFEDQMLHVQILVQKNDISFFARGDAAVGIIDADGFCRIDSGAFDCTSQRDSHFFHSGAHAVHQVCRTACNGAVSQGSQISNYLYRLAAKGIITVGKTGSIMLSLIRQILSSPNILKVVRTVAGCR